ncbi:hypothetical protein FIBSPDRAFT_905277 [Athelia psychrophila]|uniref:Uncharacterized protein n=1 Tax=Athelia psychrophila TaxID=1759441 RepID=A0A167TMI5_9AGAM|nr:hypothetical protein FIBSPDRAFT_905277 [Fibularhizoctonia sp. CBS 109695]
MAGARYIAQLAPDSYIMARKELKGAGVWWSTSRVLYEAFIVSPLVIIVMLIKRRGGGREGPRWGGSTATRPTRVSEEELGEAEWFEPRDLKHTDAKDEEDVWEPELTERGLVRWLAPELERSPPHGAHVPANDRWSGLTSPAALQDQDDRRGVAHAFTRSSTTSGPGETKGSGTGAGHGQGGPPNIYPSLPNIKPSGPRYGPGGRYDDHNGRNLSQQPPCSNDATTYRQSIILRASVSAST